jgi:hypothetical protein
MQQQYIATQHNFGCALAVGEAEKNTVPEAPPVSATKLH